MAHASTAREFCIDNQLLRRNVKWFRGGLVFKAHRLLFHSTLGLRVIKKKNQLVPVRFISELIQRSGLVPWGFECPFP